MNYQSTQVYRYLTFMQRHLEGDLQVFQDVAKKAEEKEAVMEKQSQQVATAPIQTNTTSSTTTETTQYPYSFEFMFGKTIVSRLTMPNAVMLFATIDILGYLTRSETNFDKTHKNFDQFFLYSSNILNKNELKVLRNVYRHGMAHNYFPKLNVEISYRSTNPDKLFFKSSYGGLVLNVIKLEKIVVDRLSQIIHDSSLYENMESQFLYMSQKYQEDSTDAIQILLQAL